MSKSMINGDNRLRLAIQRSGRLTDDTLNLLRPDWSRVRELRSAPAFALPQLSPLDPLGQDDDIPGYVDMGTADFGIVGRNLVYEEGVDVEELVALGFGYCSLVVAAMRDSPYQTLDEVKAVEARYLLPKLGAALLCRDGRATRRSSRSAVRSRWRPGSAWPRASCELTATGSTLILNDLRQIATMLESEAVLVANKASLADPEKKEQIDRLLLRINAVRAARRFKYLMMNAPESALDEIKRIVPGLKSPTIVPLQIEGWVAVHMAIQEDIFWESIEQLRAAGATEILVSSLDKLLL